MLDVVAPQQNELALAVEVVDVDDAEARLPGASAILPRHGGHAAARQAPQRERRQRQQHENDDEGDQVIDRRRSFDAEFGQQDALLSDSDARRRRRAARLLRSPRIGATCRRGGQHLSRSARADGLTGS
jgi:hypothetical protein